jgi:hypothetical protein
VFLETETAAYPVAVVVASVAVSTALTVGGLMDRLVRDIETSLKLHPTAMVEVQMPVKKLSLRRSCYRHTSSGKGSLSERGTMKNWLVCRDTYRVVVVVVRHDCGLWSDFFAGGWK